MVCDSVSATTTFLTEAYQESFQIKYQKFVPKIVIPKKCYTYLNAKSLVKFPTLGKQKPNFATGSTIIEEAIRKSNQKVSQKCFHGHYCLDSHSAIED